MDNKMEIKDSNESTIVKYIDKKEIKKDSEIKT